MDKNKQQEIWCNKALQEVKRIFRTMEKLKQSMEKTNADNLCNKMKSKKFFLCEYVQEYDVFEITNCINEIVKAEGDYSKVTKFSQKVLAIARYVYENHKEEFKGIQYNHIYHRALKGIDEYVEKRTLEPFQYMVGVDGYHTLKNMVEDLMSKKYDLKEPQNLYEILKKAKQIIYLANRLEEISPEELGRFSEICRSMKYHDISYLGVEYQKKLASERD